MTFNLRYDNPHDGPNRWSARKDAVAQLVREQQPDVAGFQEALPHQRADLEQRLPEYRALGRGREADGSGEQCCLFLRQDLQVHREGTFWLSPNPNTPGSRGWDAELPRICTWVSLGSVTVFNTHFDHAGARAREESARLIVARLRERSVVMGDLNDGPHSPPLRVLRGALLDAGPADQGTYHEFGALENPPRIDYILVTPDLQLASAQVFSTMASDHYPVVAEIS